MRQQRNFRWVLRVEKGVTSILIRHHLKLNIELKVLRIRFSIFVDSNGLLWLMNLVIAMGKRLQMESRKSPRKSGKLERKFNLLIQLPNR